MDNHVAVEQHKCKVCTKDFDSGAILLATRYHSNPRTHQMEPVRPFKKMHQLTGWGICPDCQVKLSGTDDNGGPRVALVGCDPEKSSPSDGLITPENAWRTGTVVYMRRTVFDVFFDMDVSEHPLVFVDEEVIALISKRIKIEGE